MSQIGEKTYGADTVQVAPRNPWVRRILISVLVLVVLLVAATVGIGYYFSSVLLTVDNSATDYPLTVKAVNGQEVTLSGDDDARRPVILGLGWDGGSAILSNAVRESGDDVVRTVTTVVSGSLTPGLRVGIDSRVYSGDPRSARELNFESVNLKSELGDLPAWYVPPTGTTVSRTWVIAVHGLGASRTEALRILPTFARAGLPSLAIAYRNDVGAPASPDGYYHLGDTEWRDVVAGIDYARAHGATGVVLYAWSMGGALTMTALRRMPAADAAIIKAMVLDSANIDWTAVLDYQGSQRGLPGFVTWTAERIIEWRVDLSFSDFDQRTYAPDLKVPVLIFVDTTDKTVPNGPAQDFAGARPDLVTLVTTTGGGHTAPWNVDPTAYEAKVTGFLGQFD